MSDASQVDLTDGADVWAFGVMIFDICYAPGHLWSDEASPKRFMQQTVASSCSALRAFVAGRTQDGQELRRMMFQCFQPQATRASARQLLRHLRGHM